MICSVRNLRVMRSAAIIEQNNTTGTDERNYVDEIFSIFDVTNIEYAPNLFMNIYTAVNDLLTTRAVVFVLHAGGADYTDFQPRMYARDIWAARGYVGISLDYGVTGGFTGEKQRKAAINTAAAIRYVRSVAAVLGIDPNKIMIMGISAGAITSVQEAIAANDLSDSYFDNANNNLYLGYSSAVSASATLPGAANPTFNAYIGPLDPPNYFYHGDADPTIPISQAQDTYNLQIAAGIASTFMTILGGTHHFTGPQTDTIQADLIPKFAAFAV